MSLKEKISVVLGVILFLVICGVSYYYIFERDYTYYTQIDNTKIKENSSSDEMKYVYTLTMYDQNGKSKKISFNTSRELRENAFLKVKYYMVSGVNKWEEIQYEDLPSKVKDYYSKNN